MTPMEIGTTALPGAAWAHSPNGVYTSVAGYHILLLSDEYRITAGDRLLERVGFSEGQGDIPIKAMREFIEFRVQRLLDALGSKAPTVYLCGTSFSCDAGNKTVTTYASEEALKATLNCIEECGVTCCRLVPSGTW